jgi:hypothetical protein
MAETNLTTTAEPKTDLGRAIKSLSAKAAAYQKTTNYYAGRHNLAYASDKFKNAFGGLFQEFALNLCPAVVDAVRDKLIVSNFTVEKGADGQKDLPGEAWKIWQANRMGKRSGEIHKEAIKNGDSYAIVWVDPNKKVTIYPQKAATCTVFYDEETPGKVIWAAKYWKLADKKIRINLYYPDRIERYITKQKTDGGIPDEKKFEKFDGGKVGGETIENPYGIVPVFHFANNTDVGSFGVSELVDAMPVQDALNKSVLDMLIAMEFAAFRQRWATGIEVELDDDGNAKSPFVPGADRLWMSESEVAKFGDFEAADLEKFLKVKEGFRTDIACVTGTPNHYFMLTGAAFPQSGLSVEKLESRFLSKVRDRQEGFGQVWEELIAFALLIEKGVKDVRLFTDWQDPAPLGEAEKLQNLISKQTLGIPDEVLWAEDGYGEDDIKKMIKLKDDAAAKAAKAFNAGG